MTRQEYVAHLRR